MQPNSHDIVSIEEYNRMKTQLHEKCMDYNRISKENSELREKIILLTDQLQKFVPSNTEVVIPNSEEESPVSYSEETKDLENIPVNVLPWKEDSPFFREEISRKEKTVHNLKHHLKSIHTLGFSVCKHGKEFSNACGALSKEMSKDWDQLEMSVETKSDLNLSKSFQSFSEIFLEIQELQDILIFSFEQTFLFPVDQFRHSCKMILSHSSSMYKKTQEAFENSLNKFLQLKPSTNSETDDREEKSVELKKMEYEKARFNHVQTLNDILETRKLDIIEYIAASFYSFHVYFRSGREFTESKQRFSHNIQALLSRRRDMFQTQSISAKLEVCPPKNDRGVSGYAGYLFKKGGSYKSSWKRRWFALNDGVLQYFRSEKDLSHVDVGSILFCSIRVLKDSERKWCFEIVYPHTRNWILQAENATEYETWVQTIRKCIEQMLTLPGGNLPRSRNSPISQDKYQLMKTVKSNNLLCADCNSPNPEWASINMGIILCVQCSGVHRGLGVKYSKIRSLTLDSWNDTLLKMLIRIGNVRFNEIWEFLLDQDVSVSKIRPDSSIDARKTFIHAKYIDRRFIDRSELLSSLEVGDINSGMIKVNDVLVLLKIIATGYDISHLIENGNICIESRESETCDGTILELLSQQGIDLKRL